MTDKLKELALAAKASTAATAWWQPWQFSEQCTLGEAKYLAAASPDAILALIAENERLRTTIFTDNSQTVAYATKRIAELEATKDGAYLERNKLVSLLSKVFPSGKKKTAIEGWSEDWHGCVYIDLPTGQASWHYHDSQAELFAHLPEYQGTWDGHTTDEKYERIGNFLASGAAQKENT